MEKREKKDYSGWPIVAMLLLVGWLIVETGISILQNIGRLL